MKFKSISQKKTGYQRDNTYVQCPADSEFFTEISVPLRLAESLCLFPVGCGVLCRNNKKLFLRNSYIFSGSLSKTEPLEK